MELCLAAIKKEVEVTQYVQGINVCTSVGKAQTNEDD
jgi:hypothetical protein